MIVFECVQEKAFDFIIPVCCMELLDINGMFFSGL